MTPKSTRRGFTQINRVGQQCPPAKGHKSAFTLIELLVVVLIIGILAAVAVPQYQKAVEKSRATEAITMLDTLQKAIEVYILENTSPQDVSFTAPNHSDRSYQKLDIEVSLPLCTENKYEGEVCGTKDFAVAVDCDEDNSCNMVAARASVEEREVEGYAMDGSYALRVWRNSNGQWDRDCVAVDDTIGQSVCQSLKGTWW